MIYTFDTYYRGKIDFKRLVVVCAKYIGSITSNYEAELIIPIQKSINITKKAGKLPDIDKDKFIVELIDWIFENSLDKDLFKLFLYNDPRTKETVCEFDHHDDSCCWAIKLNEEQFNNLQNVLTQNGLPTDVFYDDEKGVCIKSKGIAGFLGFKTCYTPKEYEEYLKNSK
ncbi:MAG: hypothetical protein WCO33_02530 [bacterium]